MGRLLSLKPVPVQSSSTELRTSLGVVVAEEVMRLPRV